MAIVSTGASFIPKIWSSAIQEPYEKSLVFGQSSIVNSNVKGTFAQKGDTVHVSTMGKPTIHSYEAGSDIEIDDLSFTDSELVIDQGDYFAFYVEDVLALQAAGPVKDPAMRAAATELRDKSDKYLAKTLAAGAKNKLGTVKVVDGSGDAGDGQITAWQLLLNLRKKLNTESVPTTGRYAIVGPEVESALLNDKRFVQVDASGTSDGLRNGIIGRALGFDVLVSNNIPTSGQKETIIAGVPDAATFVNSITKVETLRADKRFADQVRGLNIYGAKVFRPEGIATAEAQVAAPIAGS